MENKEPMSFRDALLHLVFFGLFYYCMLNGYYLFLAVFPVISAVILYRNRKRAVAKASAAFMCPEPIDAATIR